MTERINGDTNKLKEERIREMLLEESKNPYGWWYLSYAGEKFNGGAIIEARGFASAVLFAAQSGISPGGEVWGIPIPLEHLPAVKYRHRRLTLAELREFWDMAKMSELDGQD
jgi:hypothetical protein